MTLCYNISDNMLNIETERKFLVKDGSYKDMAVSSHRIIQGYVCKENGRTVRVRISDDRAYLTVKGPSADGISRLEWEIEIAAEDAKDLLPLCQDGLIEKIRHIVPFKGKTFEVDEFLKDNAGLTVAEIELENRDESFSRPGWLSDEVTGDRRYYNSCLSKHPYSTWPRP